MKTRELSNNERAIIERVAAKLPATDRDALINEMNGATVVEESGDGGTVLFALPNYVRPAYLGQHSYGVEGKMRDADGTEISVILYADENNRLLELELLRWGEGNLQAPNFGTLKFY